MHHVQAFIFPHFLPSFSVASQHCNFQAQIQWSFCFPKFSRALLSAYNFISFPALELRICPRVWTRIVRFDLQGWSLSWFIVRVFRRLMLASLWGSVVQIETLQGARQFVGRESALHEGFCSRERTLKSLYYKTLLCHVSFNSNLNICYVEVIFWSLKY